MKALLERQFSHPRGILGSFVGRLMARSNGELNAWTATHLHIQRTHCILEIGHGPGTLIQLIAKHTEAGYIVGVDPSQVMHKQASQLNEQAIEQGRVLLEKGVVSDLAFQAQTFDTVVSVNTFQFWSDPIEDLQEVRRVLKPGGRLVVVLQPRWLKGAEAVEALAHKLVGQISQAGFRDVNAVTKPMRPIPALAVLGTR